MLSVTFFLILLTHFLNSGIRERWRKVLIGFDLLTTFQRGKGEYFCRYIDKIPDINKPPKKGINPNRSGVILMRDRHVSIPWGPERSWKVTDLFYRGFMGGAGVKSVAGNQCICYKCNSKSK